jgi:hypothetical protein
MFTHRAIAILKDNSQEQIELQMDCCAAAGYTGRNQDSVKKHIEELKKLGVPTPYSTPAIYWISPSRLTHYTTLVVVGKETSPEVEFLLASSASGQMYITVASDHTDRQLEAVSVGKSKQICDKILGDTFWKVDDIAEHWDQIELQSRVVHNSKWVDYQKGSFKDILHYKDLLEIVSSDEPAGKAPSLLSGTIPVIGGDAIFTRQCEISLFDPVLERKISKTYEILVLPDRS